MQLLRGNYAMGVLLLLRNRSCISSARRCYTTCRLCAVRYRFPLSSFEEVKSMTVTIKRVQKPEVSKIRGATLCG